LFGGPRLGGASWRTKLADQTGGPVWRTSVADLVGGVARGGPVWSQDSSAISDAMSGRFPMGWCGHWHLAFSGWRSQVGALRLALSDWRSHLAVSLGGASWRCQLAVSVGGPRWRTTLADHVGGPAWRCHPWRSGVEPKPISTLRCEDRKVPGGPRWSPAAGAL
jgi:hypothetical protein